MADLFSALRGMVSAAGEGAVFKVEDLEEMFTSHSRSDVISILKSLQNEGVGTFVVGRKGQPSRFEVAALSAAPVMIPVGGVRMESNLQHTFVLRKEPSLVIALPHDLTATEAERLVRWIQALPTD